MIKLKKKYIKKKKFFFFESSIGNIKIFFIDKIIKIPNNVKINIKKNHINFEGILGKLSLIISDEIFLLKKKKQLILNVNLQKNKKSIINLYNKLIKIKIKGVLQGFKLNIILKGIGFKAFIKNSNLILKLGFSHNNIIKIPSNIKIINQSNNLIFNSIDFIFLTQFVHYIKNFKKPEPYKGKGLLLKNEKILKKEGKKSKK